MSGALYDAMMATTKSRNGELMTTADIAKKVRVTPRQVRRLLQVWKRDHGLKVIKLYDAGPASLRVRKTDFERLLKKLETVSA